jgi:hypothetical protein
LDVHFIKYIGVTQMWIYLGAQAVGHGLITLPTSKRHQLIINTKGKDDADSSDISSEVEPPKKSPPKK